MSNPNEIARLAFALLAEHPESAINLRLSAGPNTVVIPDEDSSQSMHEAGTWRCPVTRPSIDLRVKLWCLDGKVKAEIHRITGVGKHPRDPDPFEVLCRINSGSFEIATIRLGNALRDAVPAEAKLGIDELMPQERVFERAHVLSDWDLKYGRDKELNLFLDRTLDSAFHCHQGERPASKFSLWFYPGPAKYGWEILVQVKRTDSGCELMIQDRLVSNNLISHYRRLPQDHVTMVLQDYFSRMHAFKFSELRVYRACAHTS